MKRILTSILAIAACAEPATTGPDATASTGTAGSSTSFGDIGFTRGFTTADTGADHPSSTTTTSVAADVTGAQGTTSTSVPWDCPPPRSAGEVPLIDDFEAPSLPAVDGREGGWYVYNDGTGGVQTPEGSIERSTENPHRGQYAGRTHGEGFTDWGAAMALAIQTIGTNGGGNCPYDASAYDGITFWARGEDRIFVHITTMNTAPVDQGGRCAVTAECWDDFGAHISLTDEWTRYTLAWDELAQSGWGLPTEFDPREILLLHWQDEDASSFDIWIDDVSFWSEEVPGASTSSSSGTGGESDGGGTTSTTGSSGLETGGPSSSGTTG